MNVIKIRKNDIVRNVNPIKLNYSDRVIPVNTEFTVWKANRDGRLACYAIDRTYGYGSIYLKDSDVVKIEKPLPKVNVGDVFVSTGGYEQTNVTFYRVSAVKKASLEVVVIGSDRKYTGPMCGEATPVLTSDGHNRKTVRICVNGDGTVSFKAIWGRAYRWDGEPEFFSEWH